MPVPSTMADLSTTASSNSPAGTTNVFPDLDDYLRAHAAFIAQLYDGSGWNTTMSAPVTSFTYSGLTAKFDSTGFGIGTTSPAKKLHVVGTARIERSGTATQYLEAESTLSGGFLISYSPAATAKQLTLDSTTDASNTAVSGGEVGIRLRVLGTTMAEVTQNGNIVLGQQTTVATSGTDGFAYIPTCAGVPTGTPTSYPGKVAMVVDTTNARIYIYTGGSWKRASLT